MKLYLHMFNTWFIANLIHPCLWVILSLSGLLGDHSSLYPELVQAWCNVFVISFFFSLPCLLLGIVCLRLVLGIPFTRMARFATWLVIAPSLILLQFLLVYVLFIRVEMDMFVALLPAIAATVLAIAIRCRQFMKLLLLSATGYEDRPLNELAEPEDTKPHLS